jgi:hypothetical protein
MNEQGLVDALREFVWDSKLSDAEAQMLADAAMVELWPKVSMTLLVEVEVEVICDERRGITAQDFDLANIDVGFGDYGSEAEVTVARIVSAR